MPFNFPKNPVRGDVVTVGYQQWKYNGSVWNKIRPKVQGQAGSQGRAGQDGARGATGNTGATGSDGARGATGNTGATGSDGARGATGNTGATGPVGDFVETFNGLTGAVSTTTLTLQVAGISSSGDIVSHGGTLEANNFVVDGGKIFQKGNEATTHIDFSSAQDVKIKSADDINLEPADSLNIDIGSDSADGIKFTGTQNLNFFTAGAKFLTVTDDISNIVLGDIGELTSNSKITISDQNITMTESGGDVVETFDQNYKRHVDVATFTIDASSSIATGAKTNSLYRIPYNATLKNFDVKTNATGGLTAAIRIAGPDFGNPLTSGITGCSLGIEGLTGSSTVFNQASVTAGNFILLDIFSNNSGASAAQAFLTFESR